MSVSRSRLRFFSTLSAQKRAFVFATEWCYGQPCQKHPSMNTATFAFVKTRSAVRRTSGTGRIAMRYRRPRACTARRNRSSGLVSRLLFAFMLRRTPSLDAQDAAPSARVTTRVVYSQSSAPMWRSQRLRHSGVQH